MTRHTAPKTTRAHQVQDAFHDFVQGHTTREASRSESGSFRLQQPPFFTRQITGVDWSCHKIDLGNLECYVDDENRILP